ncbi:prolactin 2 isoform X2 [Paramormyrops kingsleyae]|uniref:prolactin 2 isoform X2 n=1 Tax=Paramormyrops kingsleyae TaxID=1676925 RepID=UPI000CD607DF|nr:prolactin-like isoform X2 [Paramormyrops kingsleyae]
MFRKLKGPVIFLLMFLDVQVIVGSTPICVHGHTGCQTLSLADLFDRVIQHSARVHGLSSDLHSEYEQYFLPSKNKISKINRNCHTSYILTPNGKENAQRLAGEDLTGVILKLLLAWRDPLSQFHRSMAQHEDFTSFSGNKALEMSDMMHLLGMISNSVRGLISNEALGPQASSSEARPMNDQQLLYCFRRDSNKIQIYLKILKCRIAPEQGC